MIVVGTAGHIDHGKTTLIQRLTGIETDRLKEEKQRGISIELGFAYLDLPDGQRVGLIDVPGHERFVHHMIAGATGVDLVVLVVAADEGVMPQTREHISICELLGMRRGIVLLTKTDLVEPDWLELVRDDVSDYLRGTFLADAPVIDFSATWEGEQLISFKHEFYECIMTLTRAFEKVAEQRPFMMPVDRVFSIKGFGTVVTGTVQSGTVQAGGKVRVLPGGGETKVRRLEIHGQPAEESRAGTRTAINLPDVARNDVQRGNVLVASDVFEPVVQLSGSLRGVNGLQADLKPQFKALFHTGSAYAEAAVRILSGETLPAGGDTMVGIRLASPLAILPGDRFVLRAFSMVADYGRTLGGGTILWPGSVKGRPENLVALEQLAGEAHDSLLAGLTRLAGLAGVVEESLGYLSPLPFAELLAAARQEDGRGLVRLSVEGSWRLLNLEFFGAYSRHIEIAINEFHKRQPRRTGMPREELKSQLPDYLDRGVAAAVVERLLVEGKLTGDERLVALASFEVHLDSQFVLQLEAVERELKVGAMAPPNRDAMRSSLGLTEIELGELLTHLSEQGRAVKVSSDFHYLTAVVEQAREQLTTLLQAKGTASTQELKDLWGLTRKHLIPLAEYFDSIRLTVRTANSERRLRGQHSK
jgi:selenocysteine-specific elongation factor